MFIPVSIFIICLLISLGVGSSILLTNRYNYIQYSSFCLFFISLCLYILGYLYLISNFSYYVVLLNSYSLQGIFYKLFSIWCTHEGSILLWVWCFSLYLTFTALFWRTFSSIFFKFYSSINFFLFLYLLYYSNPFLFLDFFIAEGLELNFILHNPLVSIHPPVLYIWYLLTSIIYVYIVITTLCLSSTTWFSTFYLYIIVLVSFIWLYGGLILGSFWAYRELGWGGWWFWDSIENLALLPWLILLFGLHCLKFSLRYNNLSQQLVKFIGFSFLITFIGTFFLRSGNLDSIHNFVVEYNRGFILVLFVLLFLLVTLLYIFLVKFFIPHYVVYNNLLTVYNLFLCLLIVYILFVYWGTFYPFFVKIFFLGSITFSKGFFNYFSFAFGICLLYLIALFFLDIYLSFILGYYLLLFLYYHIYLGGGLFLFWCLLLASVITYMFLFYNLNVNFWLHLSIAALALLIPLMYIYSYNFTILVVPYQQIPLFGNYYIIIGDSIQYQNNYCLSMYLPVFLYNKDILTFTFFLEKSLFFHSKNYFVVPDISSSWLFDSYFTLSTGNSFNGWYIKVFINYYMLLFWTVLSIIGILCTILIVWFYNRIKFLNFFY